ncbi:MAG: sialate O-acetylesterase [Bacteroidota bacterium]|nr:sialate O-acetylesterase [Bacteroidota bacterium]
MNKFNIVLATFLISLQSFSEIKLGGIFSSHMVFQRGYPPKIWGKANPGEQLKLKFNNKKYETTAGNDSNWVIGMAEANTGGPYTIEIEGTKNNILLTDIMVGDVWVCSGQSNMEWPLKGCKGRYDTLLRRTNNNNIRLIKVPNTTSSFPLNDIKQNNGWQTAKYPEIMDFSAVAYFFGVEISTAANVPIGLISTNWGGSPAEVWMSASALASFPEIQSGYQEKQNDFSERKQKQKFRDENLNKWIQTVINNDSIYQQLKADNFDLKISENWKITTIPGMIDKLGLQNFDGIVWYQFEFEIDENVQKNGGNIFFGKIDDADMVWVNGVSVGGKNFPDSLRKYKITPTILKKGRNIVHLRLLDWGGNGGFSSDSIYFESNNTRISINGATKYIASVSFKSIPEYTEPDWGVLYQPWSPSGLYNAMIYPLLKFPIKGAIWYQGEGNAGRAYQYRKLFPSLINDWRSSWKQGNFPFIYVQLANFLEPNKFPKTDPWPELREAQSMALSLPNTAMAVAIDLGEEKDIHPANKLDVGKRLGIAAKKVAYNQKIVHSGPMYKNIKIENNKIRVIFETYGSQLVAKGKELEEFEIAGADQKFYYAKAKIEGNTIVLSNPKVTLPVAVRYAWSNNPSKANLYNKEGLPASPFRTDKWKGITEGVVKID